MDWDDNLIAMTFGFGQPKVHAHDSKEKNMGKKKTKAKSEKIKKVPSYDSMKKMIKAAQSDVGLPKGLCAEISMGTLIVTMPIKKKERAAYGLADTVESVRVLDLDAQEAMADLMKAVGVKMKFNAY